MFENTKNLTGGKSEIGEIRDHILLYTKTFFQNCQILDRSGEGNTKNWVFGLIPSMYTDCKYYTLVILFFLSSDAKTFFDMYNV